MLDMLKALLRSRKFWLTVVAVIITVLQDFFNLEPGVVESVRQVLLFLVGMIAVEDAAAKLRK